VTSKVSRAEKQHEKKEVKSINPLDCSVTDLELDKVNNNYQRKIGNACLDFMKKAILFV
jgi:hypothetical protein